MLLNERDTDDSEEEDRVDERRDPRREHDV